MEQVQIQEGRDGPVFASETQNGLKAGLLFMSQEYFHLMQEIDKFQMWFEHRSKVQIIPLDVFKVGRIINDLTKDWLKIHMMYERFRYCSEVVCVHVSLPMFRRPAPHHVSLPPHLKPLTRFEIANAMKLYQKKVLEQNPETRLFGLL